MNKKNLYKKFKYMAISLFLSSSLFTITGCPEIEQEKTPQQNTQSSPLSNNSSVQTDKKVYNPEIGVNGGTRIDSTTSPPKTFNVYLATETSSTAVLGMVYEGLVETNAITTEVQGVMAESWTISPDNLTYIFKLRKGLKWSNGQPISVDDVVFTYKDIIDNKDIPNNYRDGMLVDGEFPKVEKIDDLTVKFTTKKPFAPFLRQLSAPIMPKHVLGNTTHKDKSGKVPFNQMWGLDTDVKKIVCNGPFKIDEYSAGQRVTLVKNPYYWRKDAKGGSLPYLDKYIFEVVKDLNVEVIKFKAMESSTLAVQGQDYELLKPLETKLNFTIHDYGPTTGTTFVMFNMTKAKDDKGKPIIKPYKTEWFRDVRFRRALAHAIDKSTIIRNVYRNFAVPQISDISQTNPFYNPNVQTYEYNLEKAASLLKEAGFKKNTKNELIDSKGNRVEFDLVTNKDNVNRDAICALIRADWEKLGIKVNYRPVLFNIMVQQIDQTLDWEAMMIGLTGDSLEPHSGINVWNPHGRMHMFNMGKDKGTTYEQWEWDIYNLFKEGSTTLDRAKRKEIYNKSQVLISQQIPFLYTVNTLGMMAIRNNIGNAFPSIHGGNSFIVNWNSYHHFLKP